MQDAGARIVAAVGQKVILDLEADVVGADAGTQIHPAARLQLVAHERPDAGDDLSLIELQQTLLGRLRRSGRARRRRRRDGVAIRPVLPQIVLHGRVDADAKALPNAKLKRQDSARAAAVLHATDVDDGERQWIVEIACSAVDLREQFPITRFRERMGRRQAELQLVDDLAR